MKRVFTAMLATLMLAVSCLLPAGATDAAEATVTNDSVAASISVSAKAAYLIDMDTGVTLYDYNGYNTNYPASTTKVMTAYLCLKYGNPNDYVTVSASALSGLDSASLAGLVVGETMTVHRLLQGLLVVSGCDAANVVAEYISGSTSKFVELMNREAKALGCTGTHFANCHGLPNTNHYSTAHDMALIAQAAMQYQEFRNIVGSSVTVMAATNKHAARTIRSTNGLLPGSAYPDYSYDYAIGIKTGHTTAAGYCLLSAANKDGKELLCVVMGCDSRTTSFAQSKKLLEWGYNNYASLTYGKMFTVSAGTQGDGSGSVSGGGTYVKGKTAVVTATPSQGSAFRGWFDGSGNLLSSDASYSFGVSGDTAVYARFVRLNTVSVQAQGSGSVSGAGSYETGAQVTLTATPVSGYSFAGWYDNSGTLISSQSTYTFTASGNVQLVGRFGGDVTVYSSRSGSVSGGGICRQGETTTLTAQPKTGHSFVGWYNEYGTLLSDKASYSFQVGGNTKVIALFSGDKFYDLTDSDWYLEDVMESAEKGIIKGMTEISFGAELNMTRGQMVTVLARLEGEENSTAAAAPFTDVASDQYYAKSVNWAYAAGVVEGMSDTEFAPDASITRQEFVTMVVRYLEKVKGITLEGQSLSFKDASSIGTWAQEAVEKAVAIKLIEGYEDSTFRPQRALTRAEGVTILMRMSRYLEELESSESVEETPAESPAEETPASSAEAELTETPGETREPTAEQTEQPLELPLAEEAVDLQSAA